MTVRAWAPVVALAVVAGLIGGQAQVMAGGRARPADRGSEVRAQAADRQGLERRTLDVGGLERTYSLYVPRGVRGTQAPLVVAFHGGGQSAERFARGVGLREMADRYGFVMAVPDGVEDSWNAGGDVPEGFAEENGIDDLAFVSGLLDDILATGVADPGRVFAMGVSLGGMMTYDAACNLPGRFRAVAVVAGTLSSGRCDDPEGVSLLHIHGTADDRVPFEGGRGEFTASGRSWPSAREGILTFARNAQCGADWTSSQVTPDTVCSRVACPGSEEVEYCLVEGGGHAWPGVATTRRQQRQGAASSTSFDATDQIAQFFLAH